jgi:hypothetical protein
VVGDFVFYTEGLILLLIEIQVHDSKRHYVAERNLNTKDITN